MWVWLGMAELNWVGLGQGGLVWAGLGWVGPTRRNPNPGGVHLV